LPFSHDTPNLHFLSILDFVDFCKKKAIRVEKAFYFASGRRARILPNLFAETGVFLISQA
jgi:hypothetical protein